MIFFFSTLRPPLRLAATLVVLAAIGYLGPQTWRRTLEVRWLVQADSLPQYSPSQISALEHAFQTEHNNSETAYRIGEAFRLLSWQGKDDYRKRAEQAMGWLQQAMRLNRWDPYSLIRYGICLDWIGKIDLASPYFDRAYKLDPNGYYTVAHLGWHCVQQEDYSSARKWFERSLRLYWVDNPIADTYLKIIGERLVQEPPAR